MNLPLELKPYTFIFHAVLIAGLLTGMGYAIFPTQTAGETIIRLTAFFILLAIQSFLWMMRERAFAECQREIKELKEAIAFRAKNGYPKDSK